MEWNFTFTDIIRYQRSSEHEATYSIAHVWDS